MMMRVNSAGKPPRPNSGEQEKKKQAFSVLLRFPRIGVRGLLATLFAALCLILPHAARAEGSRSLYPSGISGSRANLEWRTNTYGGLLLRRTLLKVYANAGEYILVGSSANAVGSGNILIFDPGRVSGPVGGETIPGSPDFQATSQAGKGKITSRALELAGPKSADGTGNTGGFAPAFYVAPTSGIYSVIFYGTDGANSAGNGGVTGDVSLASANNFNTTQGSSVAAWDVTVRDSAASTTDLDGRLFSDYLALFTGGNGLPLYSTVYAATTDGYQYRIDLKGLDPNGFIIYGNQIGFLDADGLSPLYHDVLGADGQVSSIQGGCSLAPPSYPIFFHLPDNSALSDAGIATSPITPVLSGLSFSGTAGSNNSRIGTGGTFSFTCNISAVYDIIISRDGVDFDPTNTGNRRLRGVRGSGTNTVSWDGKDNSGVNFPVGTGYAVQATVHAGEYHFPLLDAENSTQGGPNFTLLNASNPLGNSTGFYDDRGYRASSGFYVTSDSATSVSGSASKVGLVLGGINPPNPAFSNPITGFNTTSSQRTYGQASGGNTNTPNTGSFGDTKGLDIWTYLPSSASSATLNIQGPPHVLLVKRITAVNGVNTTGFDDDPGTTDDNSPYWPAPASTYLRGVRSVSNIKPGDELEYTIYFLDTNGPGTNIILADVLPTNTTFETMAYNGLTPTDGGTPGADSGIALALSSSSLPAAPTNYLSNTADSDRGQYYPPGTQAPAAANPGAGFASPLPAASNLNGVVAVTLAPNPATLPSATGAGTPTGSYGFLRFRVRVN